MRIATLKIKNFRGIREGFVQFRQHTVFAGTNNCGKSTIIEALTLLFGRDRLIRELTEHDFYGSDPQPADRIELLATVTGFQGDDPERNIEWFRDGRAVPKWFDEATGAVHAVRTEANWRLCCQIGCQAYFDRDTLAVEMVRYFHDHDQPIDPFVGDMPVAVPGKLIQQLGLFVVRTNRSWDKVLSWGSELFRRTVHVAAAQPSDAILAERDRLRAPANPIEEDPRIAPLLQRVNMELARCVPGNPEVQLRVTGTDSRSVLEAVSAHFATPTGTTIPVGRHGSGLVSLQGLLLLLELGRARAEQGDGFALALEEPEIHLSPPTQLQLVHRVQGLSNQTFITTHSPTVAALANPTDVVMLRNENGMLSARPFLIALLAGDAPNWKRKFFQQNRVEVLSAMMHPSLLIPEGRADFYLLRSILRPLLLTEGWVADMERPFGLEVGVIPTDDAKVVETYRLISPLHPRACCLVDGDRDGLRYIAGLRDLPQPPASILRWHDGAMVEDVIGWILDADAPQALPLLASLAAVAPHTVDDVVARLKEAKVDIVAYEMIADAIVNTPSCRRRAVELFDAIASVCAGIATDRFSREGDGTWVFVP
jgi:putative ATP-dependent endonuclease of the OLD family